MMTFMPFRKTLMAAAGAATLAMLAGGCAPAVTTAFTENAPAPVKAARKPNVVLIIADDLNVQLGTYGAPVISPNIDRLAREGVRFDRAYTQWPVCGASRASFLTGRRPDTIGREVIYERFRCSIPDAVTLPQHFRQNGYFSARIGKAYHQGVPSDIGRDGDDDGGSWDVAINPVGLDKAVEGDVINMTPGLGLGRANAWLAPDAADEEFTDGKVASEAIRLMNENRDRPFFLTVGFYRPHVPEIAPKHWLDRYPAGQVALAEETAETLAAVLPIATNSDVMNLGMTETQQRQMIAAYRAAVSHMDTQVGRVLAELDRLGLADDTIVMFIGDHGFMLGEHGQWQKTMLYEEAVQVPMIVRAPGIAGGNAVARTVEMLDIYPTLAALAGLPARGELEGVSLVPLLKKPDIQWDRPAFSQIWGGRSVRTERWRYTEWEQGRSGAELYDHDNDPREQHNLAEDPAYAAVVAKLKAMFPAQAFEARGTKTLLDPQTPKKRQGSRPAIEGCEGLERLIG